MNASRRIKIAMIVTGLLLAAWPLLALERLWLETLPKQAGMINAVLLLAVSIGWAVWSRKPSILAQCAAATLGYVAVCVVLLKAADAYELYALRNSVSNFGSSGFYVIGLLWVIWLVDLAGRRYEDHRFILSIVAGKPQMMLHEDRPQHRAWNPLDPAAWYYGRGRSKLNQSMFVLAAYSVLFMLAGMLITWLSVGKETYDLPGGGGGGGSGGGPPQSVASAVQVKVKKVIKKKFVINPFSSIKFGSARIDDVKLQLQEVTDHMYTVGQGQGGAGSGKGSGFGYGDGDGSGFAGGNGLGKIRFIRLEYAGGDWDQDFGVGADLNLLIEYGVLTGQKVSDRTESRTVAQLAAFPPEKSPPLVYMTGQGSISMNKSEIKTLREYLLMKHGMLFCDNGGSQHFHNQFFSLMRQVLPEVEPVRIPLDDIIHRIPFAIPFLPYVAPHGGKDAWGWKVDGRWVCYYHPGDIGDAWSDGHSGVPRDIWVACYQLGTNVIFYAHMEYSKWLTSKPKK